MFEKPITMYEGQERKKELAVRDAIKYKLFSIDIILQMIEQSKERDQLIEEFVLSKENPVHLVREAFYRIQKNLNPATERTIALSLIKREDCPQKYAMEFGKIAFPDLKTEKELKGEKTE